MAKALRIALCVSIFLCAIHGLGAESQLISLGAAARSLEAEISWDPLTRSAVLARDGHLVSLRTDDELVLFDYRKCAMLDAPRLMGNEVFLTKAFVDRLGSFFATLPPPPSYRVGAILIDPGHGGKDPGAIGSASVNGKSVSLREKDIVLTVAKEVFARLRAKYPDKQILLTRSGDSYPSLEDRVEMANSVKLADHEAIIYISIHANAAFNQSSSGFEVWYLTPDYRRTVIDKTDSNDSDILPILNTMMEEEFTTESILIAKNIMEEMNDQVGKLSQNRGMKEESWFVVRNARMPSVLVELGFVSNPTEAKLLADPEYLQKCASGIYNGLSGFISHFENSRGFTSIQ